MPAYLGDVVTPTGLTTLLDAKITWSITDTIALNMGRYIPHTSMSQQPHQIKVHKLIDPPMMITGGGYIDTTLATGAVVLAPLPRYQTGIGVQAAMGPATITWDFFDGVQVATPDSLSDMDRMKGGVVKLALDSGSLHGGIFYLNEMSMLAGEDNTVTQMGLEVRYMTERFIAAMEYLDTLIDQQDTDVEDLRQNAYYILLGAVVGPVELILRYDYAEAGLDEWMDDMDIDVDEDEVFDQQTNITIGVNYNINDVTTVALNYVMRQLEEPDVEVGGEDVVFPATDEIALMVELDVL
jgi:hypothetical protein